MIKYLKSLFVFFFLYLFCLNASGQTQTDFLEMLSDKFQKYCYSFPREEIYVHTDRNEYVAGEDIWFGIYLFDRQSSKPSSESKIAYFEILNPENRPVVQKRIRLEKGFGPGQIVLPDTLSSGNYKIRAYTNWMKSFLPYNCFSMNLGIYNALNNKSFKVNSNPDTSLIKQAEKSMISDLPESPVKIKVNNLNPESVEIEINADQKFRSQNSIVYYLFVQTHGIINFKSAIYLTGDVTRKDIPRTQLIPGINHITIFNASGQPVSEKYVYTPFNGTRFLNILSSDNYKTRDKISLEIEISNESGSIENPLNLSISVAPVSDNTFPDIDDYMIFGSEFGSIPDEILRSDINGMQPEKLENFLSTLKSNWINWNTILSGDLPVLKYKKETKNHLLAGRLLNKYTQVPDSGQYLFLSIPGKNATFQYAVTDENGNFSFTIPLDNRIRNLIIQPEEAERNNNIKIETSFSDKYPEFIPFSDTLPKKNQMASSKFGINYQIMKIYKSDNIPDKSEQIVYTGGSKRFYGKPDIELLMDNYIKLPVMQEIFLELMPGVSLKEKKSGYEITIKYPVENNDFNKPPLLLIDGVVVRDPALIANLDPELVEKIDVVKSIYVVGKYRIYGLVNIITKAGNFSNITLPDYAVMVPFRSTEPVKSFSYPDYSSEKERENYIPDFRNTLYWNPSVKPDKNGDIKVEFWSSDYVSDYEVSVQGISYDGIPFSFKKLIRVQKPDTFTRNGQ